MSKVVAYAYKIEFIFVNIGIPYVNCVINQEKNNNNNFIFLILL